MGRPLAIQVLEVVVYPPDGSRWTNSATHDPTWAQVESAIRALDHHGHPFINLCLRAEPDGTDCMNILGGPNGYALNVADSEACSVQYHDRTHTGGEVPVWTSDQGYYPEEKYVTYDLDLVLRLARHYAEQGQPDPSAEWEVV